MGLSPVSDTWIELGFNGRFAGGVIPCPSSSCLLGVGGPTPWIGVVGTPGLAATANDCIQPPGVATVEAGFVMAGKTGGGTKVAMVGSQHKESWEGNQGSATMQRWFIHTHQFCFSARLEPDDRSMSVTSAFRHMLKRDGLRSTPPTLCYYV